MSGSAKIGAFFDLDGTLLPPPSLESRFFAHLLASGEISGANIARWLGRCARTILRDRSAAIEANKLYLAELRESLVAEWTDAAPDSSSFFLDGMAQLAWHHAQGHRVFLVTGTLAPLARAIAQHFPCPVDIVSSELEIFDGHWTGWLLGAHMSGKEKARAIRELAAQYGLDLSQSYGYGDHASDIPMLEAAGNPAVVNPSRRVARLARMHGWRICSWCESSATSQDRHTRILRPTEAQ
jgi:HAD superfamily hydrolase (TIGR01490 family)